jgi:hypothetical protein
VNRDVFLLLDPRERVALVLGFGYQRERRDDSPQRPLSLETVARLEAVELALVDLDANEEQRGALREDWLGYLDRLPDADAQDVEARVQSFALLLDGLLRSDARLDNAAAQNGGESV